MAGESYIGSKISLISLSDIRYVGVLHSINAQDSTVGLKQVKSFGTEGRRGKFEEEIPGSDNVFDYVVFRGSDIKDLQVFEAPPKPTPPPQTNLPQDPAIMSMSGGYPPMNPYMNNNMYMQPPPAANNYWQPPSFNEEAQAELEKNKLDELRAELDDADQPTINEAVIEELAKKVSELNPTEDAPATSVKATEDRRPRYNNNNSNRGGRYRQYNNKKELSIPSSEFDFEASNAKFDKNTSVEDQEKEVEIPETEEFYDKKSSFFDNISCESKERSEQPNEPRRNRFQEERKLNMETFGQATVDQTRYRNNYNNRGGRGGYRGGRGGYYRNNSSNSNSNNRNNNNSYNNNYRQNNKSQPQQ